MIYLINVTYYNKETKEILDLLKIGYTDNWDKRKSQYLLHNPGIQELYLLEDGSEEQESKLHYKFKDLKYLDYGNEWFYYSEDIINYVKTVTLEELDKLPKSPTVLDKEFKKLKWDLRKMLSYILILPSDEIYSEISYSKSKTIENYLNSAIDKLGKDISENSLIEFLKDDANIDNRKIEKYLEIKERSDTGIYTEDRIVNEEVSNFLRVYETLTTIYDKLKYLSESSISKEGIDIILAQIPDSDSVKSYYLALGPKRLYELGYNISRIKKELGIATFSPDLLLNSIYSNFHVEEKYKLSDLKDKISMVYGSINYAKTPKASEIMEYFKIKEISIYDKKDDGGRKRSKGYELIESYEQKIRENLKYSN